MSVGRIERDTMYQAIRFLLTKPFIQLCATVHHLIEP